MFDAHDRGLWTPGYRTEARRTIGLSVIHAARPADDLPDVAGPVQRAGQDLVWR